MRGGEAKKTMEDAARIIDVEEASRITKNLLECAELTDLCLQLRIAVLRQEWPEQEALRKVMREVRQAKERAWRQNRS